MAISKHSGYHLWG